MSRGFLEKGSASRSGRPDVYKRQVFLCVNADDFSAAVQLQFNDEIIAVVVETIPQFVIIVYIAADVVFFVKVVGKIIFFTIYFNP